MEHNNKSVGGQSGRRIVLERSIIVVNLKIGEGI